MSQMVMMVSAAKQSVISTSGHSVRFESMKPTPVHPNMVSECMAKGCIPANQLGANAAIPDDKSRDRLAAEGILRDSLITLVMQRTRKENNLKHFDSGSVPKLDFLNQTLSFDISSKERTARWQALLSAEANDEPLAIHPDAKKVLDILDAQSKADLTIVAKEVGATDEEIGGLSTRDLRRHLLSKFPGLTSA